MRCVCDVFYVMCNVPPWWIPLLVAPLNSGSSFHCTLTYRPALPCHCRCGHCCSDEAGVSDGAGAAALEAAARLLGVSDVGLEAALTTRAIEARGEHIVKRLDAGEYWVRGE